MSKFLVQPPVLHIPKVKEYEISRLWMWNRLRDAWHWDSIKLDDNKFFYVCWEDWGKIFDYIMPKMPKYRTATFDCDNCADWLKVKVAEVFKINTCARVDGYADVGRGYPERHAWSLFFDGEEFYQLESQTEGAIYDIKDPKYVPDELIMG